MGVKIMFVYLDSGLLDHIVLALPSLCKYPSEVALLLKTEILRVIKEVDLIPNDKI